MLLFALACAHPPAPVPPPMGPLSATDAFYIISMPAPEAPVGVHVCADEIACMALLPEERPYVSLDFTRESWVVVQLPPHSKVDDVISDGSRVTVILASREPPSDGPQIALYRVAKSVKEAMFAR